MSESIFIVAQKSVHTLNTANAIVSTFTEKTKEKDEQIIKQQTIRNCESQTENRIQRVRKYFENERTNKRKERRNKPFEIEIPLIASHICVCNRHLENILRQPNIHLGFDCYVHISKTSRNRFG